MVSSETTDRAAWTEALLRDPHAVADKRSRVRQMFAAIAPSYDLNNRLHSLWMDQRWRRKAVKLAGVTSDDQIIDVACGTGDLTLAFAKVLADKAPGGRGRVIGIDFTYEMLPIAARKSVRSATFRSYLPGSRVRTKARTTNGRGGTRFVGFIHGDAQSLPLPDACADVVSIAFGIRNVADPVAVLREFRRVTRPGGRVVVLEFSLPTNAVLRGLYNFYFRKILPLTATLISGDKTGAYKYLPESVNTFIGRESMMRMMSEAGFAQVTHFAMTFGVCVCYRGVAV